MTTSCFDREDEIFIVLFNQEGQYSIWPHWKAVPGGWKAVKGIKGDKKTVLAYVDKTWTDMRPRSLRVAMGETLEDIEEEVFGMEASNVAPMPTVAPARA